MQVKAWHRHSGGAVASLSTCDGIVFELAWFPADQWTVELARITAVPEDLPLSTSQCRRTSTSPTPSPTRSARRCARVAPTSSRCSSAMPTVRSSPTASRWATPRPPLPCPPSTARAAAGSASSPPRSPSAPTTAVGVVSWVLLRDGWHSLTPRHDDGARVAVGRVDPDDLATELAPVLAQVTRSLPDMSNLDIPAHAQGGETPEQASASVAADKYDQMLALADLFDSSGNEMRTRARLGSEILSDDDVVDSGELSRATWGQAEEDIRAATTGKHGLLTRSVELDADALVVRATVLTYRWIDELQQAAYKTLGSIAGRAIGYLAPEVALGGAIVSAGLIETDAMDRDGVTAYLNELAENNPELMDHLSGGGGLLDGLHMRSLLTAGVLDQRPGRPRRARRAARDRRRPVPRPMPSRPSVTRPARSSRPSEPAPTVDTDEAQAPRSLEELMANLAAEDRRISIQRVGTGRYIAYLPGHLRRRVGSPATRRRRPTTQAAQVVRAIEKAVTDDDARVMLVGSASGGAVAAEIAASLCVGEVRGRPGRDGRLPVGPGAADPRAPRACCRWRIAPTRSRSSARSSTPGSPTASPWSSTAQRPTARTPTSPAPVPPTAPTTPSCARRSPGCRSWATSPVEPA